MAGRRRFRNKRTKEEGIRLTAQLREWRLEAWHGQDERCYWCGVKMKWSEATAEHLTPIRHGGLDVKENIVAAHDICNSLRADMTPQQFVASGMLAVAVERLAKREEMEE